jgi:hypothetical protein
MRAHHVLPLALLALAACAPRIDAPPPRVLDGLVEQLPAIEHVTLRGAGGGAVVTLDRQAGGWTVRERGGWPADRAQVRDLLADAAGARRIEAKTDRVDRHARLGVEDVVSPDAAGIEVVFDGAHGTRALLVGKAPPAGTGRFVRVAGERQAWRTDRGFKFARTPTEWLNTRLLQVPLPYVLAVHSRDAAGHAFELRHVEDRFRIADLPPAAMGDSYRGDTLAGVLTDLRLDDVAADDGSAAERSVRFDLRNGSAIELDAWRVDGRLWVRVRECEADARCLAPERLRGRRFLLPDHVAPHLLLTRDAILGRIE